MGSFYNKMYSAPIVCSIFANAIKSHLSKFVSGLQSVVNTCNDRVASHEQRLLDKQREEKVQVVLSGGIVANVSCVIWFLTLFCLQRTRDHCTML